MFSYLTVITLLHFYVQIQVALFKEDFVSLFY